MLRGLIFFIVSVGFLSCDSKSDPTSDSASYYIYLAHTRTAQNDSIINAVYDLDFSAYDATLLGGDLATLSFQDGMIHHLDSIFDFKNEQTLWAVGNHDEATPEEFYSITAKGKYHAFQQNDISFITLNSQDSLSSIIGEQKDFLFGTLDTLTTKNIIILSHKLIFMDQHPVMDSEINSTCNANKGDCYHCHNVNNFQQEVYPKLKELNNKNIIWVGGDLGFKKTRFEYEDNNGILFLGNGMDYKRSENEIILFKQDSTKLSHRFVSIDTLLSYQRLNKPLQALFKQQ